MAAVSLAVPLGVKRFGALASSCHRLLHLCQGASFQILAAFIALGIWVWRRVQLGQNAAGGCRGRTGVAFTLAIARGESKKEL